jgi:hypothetical protein
MRIMKTGGVCLVLGLFALPEASFAYQSGGDFPGTGDGPALASDHSQQLDFGLAPSGGLGLVSEGHGANLNESRSLQRPMAQPKSSPSQNSPSEFDRDFYGIH